MPRATSQISAIALDFFHDAAAAIWIGGLIFLGFIAAPRILEIADEKVKATAISLLIPRFSIIVVVILGVVAITGPLLLYSIESDLSLILASMYGQVSHYQAEPCRCNACDGSVFAICNTKEGCISGQ